MTGPLRRLAPLRKCPENSLPDNRVGIPCVRSQALMVRSQALMVRSFLRNGRKHHGTSSSRQRHDRARRQSCNTASAAFVLSSAVLNPKVMLVRPCRQTGPVVAGPKSAGTDAPDKGKRWPRAKRCEGDFSEIRPLKTGLPGSPSPFRGEGLPQPANLPAILSRASGRDDVRPLRPLRAPAGYRPSNPPRLPVRSGDG